MMKINNIGRGRALRMAVGITVLSIFLLLGWAKSFSNDAAEAPFKSGI